jgi:hypothetical protein
MLSLLRAWRERGWTESTPPLTPQAWQRFGGSVATHPVVVERLAGLARIPVRYLGWFAGDQLLAAIPCWGRHLALSKEVLKKRGQRGCSIWAMRKSFCRSPSRPAVPVRWRMRYVSELNAGRISTLRPQPQGLALARAPEDYSKKFRYNQRRELRLLEEAGGRVRPIGDFSPVEQAAIYANCSSAGGVLLPRARRILGGVCAAARIHDRRGAVAQRAADCHPDSLSRRSAEMDFAGIHQRRC